MKNNKRVFGLHKLPPFLKFLIAFASAFIVYLLVRHRSVPIQVMSTWVCFSLVIMAVSWTIMLTAHPRDITQIAKNQDFSRFLIFLIIVVSSFVSLVTIVLLLRELPAIGEKGYYFSLVLSIASIGSSWFLIHTIFASHYAHLFYASKTDDEVDKTQKGGLEFPNKKTPDYMDFAYFSFVIGMTFQVSDVAVSSDAIRRQVLLHGLISFLFNTIIVAVTINIIAGLVQK